MISIYSYKKKRNLDDHENNEIPHAFNCLLAFVLWCADKKLTYGRFFHFSSHIIEDFEMKIKTPRIRRGVSKKKTN